MTMRIIMTADDTWCDSLQLRMFRWTGAALFAIGMHVSVLAILLSPPQSTDADIEGSIAVELAPVAAGSPIEMPKVPPGPPTPEQTAAAPAATRLRKPESVEAPAVEQSPLAPNPEVSLPLQRPKEKEEPVEKQEAEEAEQKSQPSAASLPAAPPRDTPRKKSRRSSIPSAGPPMPSPPPT